MRTSAPRRPNALLLTIPAALLAAPLAGCAALTAGDDGGRPGHGQLFRGMGAHHRPVSTVSVHAQAYFDQGLTWAYSFNHDEAVRSFQRAAEIDPDCAMAWWGVALCEGPNYNDPDMTPERNAAAWAALQEARARVDGAAPVERALIEALAARYAPAPWPEDRAALEQAYADAMAAVWERFPDDTDVGTLYAEALMVRNPWKLYTDDREPVPEADAEEIVAVLERVLALNPENPGANHLYIHAVEPSADPGRGVPAADRLSGLVPGSGHMRHMPSHIYAQVGMWDEAVYQNELAMEADTEYLRVSPEQTIQHMYMVHNAHMRAFCAMMVGREREAMESARAMWSNVPEEALPVAGPFLDRWMSSVWDVQKRFGRWQEILDEPAPPDFMPITQATWHAHRAIAHAALQDFPDAELELARFRRAMDALPEDLKWGRQSARHVLEVSDWFIRGEIALQRGDLDRAAELLERGAQIEDTLGYGEPPQWLQPIRHTLGAVYLEDERYEDAERVYREDLAKWRDNGWSLYGLGRALAAQGKDAEAREVQAAYARVWADADEPTTTSCKCIPRT